MPLQLQPTTSRGRRIRELIKQQPAKPTRGTFHKPSETSLVRQGPPQKTGYVQQDEQS
jgi:hypothetical protein